MYMSQIGTDSTDLLGLTFSLKLYPSFFEVRTKLCEKIEPAGRATRQTLSKMLSTDGFAEFIYDQACCRAC